MGKGRPHLTRGAGHFVEVTRIILPGRCQRRNLREFVDRVAIIGLLGTDRSGQQLRELLSERKIDTLNVVEEQTFHTIVKPHHARNQQVVRVDREKVCRTIGTLN